MPLNDAKKFVEKLRLDDGFRERVAEIMRKEGYIGSSEDLQKLATEHDDAQSSGKKASYCSSLSWHKGDRQQCHGTMQGYEHWAG